MTGAARLLRYARGRAGLSQRALATKAGVPQSQIARIESGRVDPAVGSLSRLLRACGTTLEAEPGTGEGVDATLFRTGEPVRERLDHGAQASVAVARLAGQPIAFDPVRVLGVLVREGVRFVLIGWCAALAHGSAMVVSAVDICYARTPLDVERLCAAIPELHSARSALEAGAAMSVVTGAGRLTAHARPPGTRGYDDLVRSARQVDLGDCCVDVGALDDLIRIGRAAAHPEDLWVVENLLALRDAVQ